MMIRFVIRRKMLDRNSGLASEGLETVDCECPELERVLIGGGTAMDAYDYREIAGAEVLPQSNDRGLLREALAWIENSQETAPSLCGDIRKELGLPSN
jgi:hypothetical protein